MLGEKANRFKAQYLHGKHGRICGRYKREGGCALPGEISRFVLIIGTTIVERRWDEP